MVLSSMNLSANLLLNEEEFKNSCFSNFDTVYEFVISLHEENHDIFIVLVLLSAILSVFTCFGNSMVLLAYIKSSLPCKKLSSVFVINLAFTDCVVGVIVHPLLIIFFVQTINHDSSCLLPSILALIIPILMMVSLFSVAGATAERFLAIVYPFYHKTELTKTRLRVFVLLSWMYAMSWISVMFLSKNNLKIFVTLNSVLPIIMTTFTVILWFYIFFEIRGQSIVGITIAGRPQTILQYRLKSERKTAKTFLIATLSLYVSYSPLIILVFTNCRDARLITCFLEIMLLVSVINPIIYGFGNTVVKNAIRKDILCK